MARLLVVDDQPNVLYSLKKGLASESLEVVTAGTGKEGIELVRAQSPDVVILDVRLPDMSGLNAFDRIHQLDPKLPVIVITAFAATETAIEAIKRGLGKGGVKSPDEASLLLGMAYVRANNNAEAAKAFSAVKQDQGLARIAKLWLLKVEPASGSAG